MILSDEDRVKFILYLDTCIKSADAMAEQLGKKPGPIYEELAKRERVESMAMQVVSRKLKSMESFSVEG